MKPSYFLIATLAFAPGETPAESLRDKLTRGASQAGDAVSKGASKAGGLAKGAANSVGRTLESTQELVSDEETPELTRQRLDMTAETTLQRLFLERDAARDLFDQSSGYAVFDTRQVAIAGVAAGYGRGVAVSTDTDDRTYMNMGTGGLGLGFGIGGFERQVVILFETPSGFLNFVENGYDATANTDAVFGDDKTEHNIRFVDGRSIFVLTKKGWRVSASAAGTRYWADAELN